MQHLSCSETELLNAIRISGPITRAELSDITGMSQTKVFDLTRGLIHRQLITEKPGKSSGGRRPMLLQIASNLRYTIGIDLGTQNLRAIILDTAGNIRAKAVERQPLRSRRLLPFDCLTRIANEALSQTDLPRDKISGICVGITGIVDEISGSCLFLPAAPEWKNAPVVRMLQDATGISNVSITDSARCMALSESRYGLGQGIKNFITVTVGIGLGAGIVIDGKILSGSRGIAGELGHIYVGELSSLCCCGNHGCLESVASGWALSQQASEAMSNGVVTNIQPPLEAQGEGHIQSVIEAARDGDKFAVNLLDEIADYLSIGISTLINILSPERIIICGGLAEGAGNLLMSPLIHKTHARSLPWLQKDIDIRLSTLGEYSAAWGAATYAMDKLFETRSGNP